MIFIKNPIAGKVKTRLAASVGEVKALQIYKRLLDHTIEESQQVPADRQVWYSSYIDENDDISPVRFHKKEQLGADLGERMRYAFEKGFEESYKKIIIIGSDCPGITTQIINQAYLALGSNDVVIGPSEDGGYYLLGMNGYYPGLFSGINWSTGEVLNQTLAEARKQNLNVYKLPVLNDIDTEEDLRNSNLIE